MATQQKFEKLEFNFTPNPQYVDEDERQKVLDALEEEGTVSGAAEALGIRPSMVGLVRKVEEHGLIPFRNQSELQKKIVKERDKGFSWAAIGVRLGGMSEGRVQSLYEAEAGVSYEKADIGKGGRPKGGGDPKPKAKSKGKGGSKKSTKSKSKGSTEYPFPEPDPEGSDDDEIREAIEGHVVTVDRPGGKTADVDIVEVQKFATNKSGDRGVKVLNTDEKTRTFAVKAIRSIN